jgi:uncharacterized delta-60 repeat protein
MRTYILLLAFLLVTAADGYAGSGTLDTSFGQQGRVFTDLVAVGYPYLYPNSEAMLVQPDGKILITGRFWEDGVSDWYGTFIVRYMPDGTLDESFGNHGKVIDSVEGYPFNNPGIGTDAALQADGKIILVGSYRDQVAGTIGAAVRRYTSSGALDTTFGSNGTAVVYKLPFFEGASIAVQPDGKLVVSGPYFVLGTNGGYRPSLGLFRLNPDGSIDSSFGSGTGKVLIEYEDEPIDTLIQPDGKILVTGNSYLNRFNSDGSFDSTFGSGGSVVPDGPFGKAILQPDGKIVVDGSSLYITYQPIVRRYNSDGSIDPSFSASFDPEFFWPGDMMLAADGKVVVTGNAPNSTTGRSDFAVIRLTSHGAFDQSFGVGGRAVFPMNAGGTNYAWASAAAMQSDGKILITGYFGFYYLDSHEKIGTLRINAETNEFHHTPFDFDGDGQSDISVFRPGDSVWYLNRSTEGFTSAQFGIPTDKIAPADYDGDGKTDIAVFRPSSGEWYMLGSNGFYRVVQFGQEGDVAAPADYDGDGRADLAVFRPSNSTWYWLGSTGVYRVQQFGQSGDVPVPGDYDADGKSDLAVWRPSNGTWYANTSSGSYLVQQFGQPGDIPVPGDYDGDGRADRAVFRPSSGNWYLHGAGYYQVRQLGEAGDIPAPADYDGDGKTDRAVFRPSSGAWYLDRSTAGMSTTQFGANGDLPTPSAYFP